MNPRGLFSCGLAGVLAAGCNYRIGHTRQPAAPAPALAEPAAAQVPLPTRTPYDGNPKARALYLEYYAMGYDSAATDYASPGCLCTAEGDPERYEAAWNGFFAGNQAGAAAVAIKRRDNHTPAPVLSGPSVALPVIEKKP